MFYLVRRTSMTCDGVQLSLWFILRAGRRPRLPAFRHTSACDDPPITKYPHQRSLRYCVPAETIVRWLSYRYFTLFLCILAFNIKGIYATQPNVPPPATLIRENEFRIPSDRILTGIALTTTADGNIVALFDNPPCLIVWDSRGNYIGEFEGTSAGRTGSSGFFAPTDISCDGGMDLIVSDPSNSEILRFNRQMKRLPPVIPDVGDQRFEPRSTCRTRDGTLLILNQADGDIYRLESDGRAVPFHHSYHRNPINQPSHIAYVADLNRVVVLDGHQLIVCTPFGKSIQGIFTNVDNPTGIGVWGDEIWIVGDGLTCIKLADYPNDGQERPSSPSYYVSSDSLTVWDVYPCKDVLPVNDDLFLLSSDRGRVVRMKIIREPNRTIRFNR